MTSTGRPDRRGIVARRAVVAAAMTLAASAAAAERPREAELRLEGAAGFDSNALREAGAAAPTSDGYTGVSAQARVAIGSGRVRGAAVATGGYRLFLREHAANVLASRLHATAQAAVAGAAEVGVDLLARDLTERGGVRDQHEGRGLVTARLRAGRLLLGGAGGWALSAPRAPPLRAFRRDGPVAAAWVAWELRAAHRLTASYDLAAGAYRAWPGERDDVAHTAGLDWTWRGGALLGGGYAFGWNRSTARSGGWRRHRVTARAALHLPLGVTAATQVALQRSDHPEGVFLAEELVGDGDERRNLVEVELGRPVTPSLEVTLKLAHYRDDLGGGSALAFRRTLAQLALGWRPGAQNDRFSSARTSPTMPRRNASTHTTNTAPVITVTHDPALAR